MATSMTSLRLGSVRSSKLSAQSKHAVVLARRPVKVMAANIVDTVRSLGHSKMASAIDDSGMAATLSEPNVTLFVPTDDAFAAAGDTGVSVEKLVKFHVCKGVIKASHLENYPKVPTMCLDNNGKVIAMNVDIRTEKGRTKVGMMEQGTQGLAYGLVGGFVGESHVADNGMIHIIDGVMIPEEPLLGQNGGYVAGTQPGSGEGRTGLDTKVKSV